jgi:hypothetical protein
MVNKVHHLVSVVPAGADHKKPETKAKVQANPASKTEKKPTKAEAVAK